MSSIENKKKTLARFLECDPNNILIYSNDNSMFRPKDGYIKYLVLTDKEADERFYQEERELIGKLGIKAFSDEFKSIIYKNGMIDNMGNLDIDKIIPKIKKYDGRGFMLAMIDRIENKVGHYYVYRNSVEYNW